MGCFDTIRVPCPSCGKRHDCQSKSGPCNLRTYNLENAPQDVLFDVNRHGPYTCEGCGRVFTVRLQTIATPMIVPLREEEEDEED